MQLTLIEILCLWLIPPVIFLSYTFYVLHTGKFCFDKNKENNWGVFPSVVGVAAPLAVVSFWWNFSGYPLDILSLGGIFGYILFEFVGGWIIFGIVYCTIDKTFQYKVKSTNQKAVFGIDPDSLEVGTFVIRQANDQFRQNSRWVDGVQPTLYRVTYGRDLTGERKFFKQVYQFPCELKSFYTREQLTKTLKDHFDNESVFTLDTQGVIVDVEKQTPEVLVIR